jgi:ankyrin repeat protein
MGISQKRISSFLIACEKGNTTDVEKFLEKIERIDKEVFRANIDIEKISLYQIFEIRDKYCTDEDGVKEYINYADNDGETALHFAIKNGNIDIVKILIAAGFSLEGKNIHGKTPLDAADEKEDEYYRDVLKKTKQFDDFATEAFGSLSDNKKYDNVLELSIIVCNTEFFNFLCNDCKALDNFEENILTEILKEHIRSLLEYENTEDILKKLLIKTKMEIFHYNDHNNNDWNLLDISVADGWDDKVKFLLEIYYWFQKANYYSDGLSEEDFDIFLEEENLFYSINEKDLPAILHIRIEKINYDLLKDLLEKKDAEGKIPLRLAIENNNLASIKLLIAAGSPIDDCIYLTQDPEIQGILYCTEICIPLNNSRLTNDFDLIYVAENEDNSVFYSTLSKIFDLISDGLVSDKKLFVENEKRENIAHFLEKKLSDPNSNEVLQKIVMDSKIFSCFRRLLDLQDKYGNNPISLKKKLQEYGKIKIASQLIAQGRRNNNGCFFSWIPEPEICISIASKVSNRLIEKESEKIAKKFF